MYFYTPSGPRRGGKLFLATWHHLGQVTRHQRGKGPNDQCACWIVSYEDRIQASKKKPTSSEPALSHAACSADRYNVQI